MLGFERVLGIGPLFRLHSNKKSWMEIVILSTQVAFTEDLINFYTILKMSDFKENDPNVLSICQLAYIIVSHCTNHSESTHSVI